MIRLKRILVPTDFSEFSKPALAYACALAARFESELHLLHVVQDPAVYVPDPTMITMEAIQEQSEELRAAAMLALAKLPEGDWDNGVPVVRDARHGSPFLEILRYARDEDIDLIVIGTHGRTGLKHVFIGSQAERVVRKAPCPVLTVRPEGHQFVMP